MMSLYGGVLFLAPVGNIPQDPIVILLAKRIILSSTFHISMHSIMQNGPENVCRQRQNGSLPHVVVFLKQIMFGEMNIRKIKRIHFPAIFQLLIPVIKLG